jgi:phosphatidylserine/phosphatidylglycerophosphate/cardiolipin synthase-like enzyme
VSRGVLAFALLAACARPAPPPLPSSSPPPPPPPIEPSALPPLAGGVELIVTPDPDGHPAFIRAIRSSDHTLRLAMFHLTDALAISELIAAQQRGVDVRVILDGASKLNAHALAVLTAAGVSAKKSSPAFSITHEKALVVDDAIALVTSINLTNTARDTRDLGLVVRDPGVIAELTAVFDADWANADTGGSATPRLSEPHLIWSPIDSETRLAGLAASAHTTLIATVENLGDADISNVFAAAARRAVVVRLIVPACDKDPHPERNYRYASDLAKAGVQVRVMPAPSSPRVPYMHSKMLVADGERGYVGSVNFSRNSTQYAREVGLLFTEPDALAQIAQIFEHDWQVAQPPAAEPPADCPRVGD